MWHCDNQLRPRLEGLTDDEYLWRREPDAWTVRHVNDAEPGTTLGLGPGVIDFTFPPPEPAPLTTIAWRLGYVIAGVFDERNARCFGGPAMEHRNMAYPLTAMPRSPCSMRGRLGGARASKG